MTRAGMIDEVADIIVHLCDEAGRPVTTAEVAREAAERLGITRHAAVGLVRVAVNRRGIDRVPGGLWPRLAGPRAIRYGDVYVMVTGSTR